MKPIFESRAVGVTSTGLSIPPTIDLLLSALRDAAAAERLFREALSDPSHPQHRVINTDKASLNGSAIAAVKAEGTCAAAVGIERRNI
jgi:transposase-like protein